MKMTLMKRSMATLRFNLFAFSLVALFLIALPLQAQAANKNKAGKASSPTKERVVLMPLRLSKEDQELRVSMEGSLVEGLQKKYDVKWGEEVEKKAEEVYHRENIKVGCTEEKCMQGIVNAFGAELLAVANITKKEDGYFLSLTITNILTHTVELQKTLPCKGCDAYAVVDKLKELSGTVAAAGVAPAVMPEAHSAKVNLSDPETALWEEAKKGNAEEDYQAYLTTYPKGKYAPLAKTKLARLKDEARAAAEQQDQQAWNTAQQGSSQNSYATYLSLYPQGQFAALAQGRIDKIKREAAAAEATQRREQAAAEAKRQQEQAAAAERQKREAAALPKGFVLQGGLIWMPVNDSKKNWSDANAYCTNTAINGQPGWRLPTKDELKALYDSGTMKDHGWTLDSTWSSTPSDNGWYYYVRLGGGYIGPGGDMGISYVTCVRETTSVPEAKQKQQTEAPKANFVSQGGLTWMPVGGSTKNWTDANAYCNNTVINGRTGWRLPTKDELKALYASGAMKGQGWTLDYIWTSIPDSNGIHYFVSLYDGYADPSYSQDENYVTCVR